MKPHSQRRLAAIACLVIATFLLAACQVDDDPSPTAIDTSQSAVAVPTSSALSSAPPGEDGEGTSILDVEVGDCFSADTSVLDTVLVVDCESSHVYEVYEVGDLRGDDDAFPGEAEVQDAASALCEAAFEDYVGLAFQDSRWFGTTVPPSESTWADGDREVVCLLHTEDESEVTRSAEGSGE